MRSDKALTPTDETKKNDQNGSIKSFQVDFSHYVGVGSWASTQAIAYSGKIHANLRCTLLLTWRKNNYGRIRATDLSFIYL